MSANREYKSSMFTTLFNDEEKLLSLYNAVSGSNLPPGTPLRIATLDNVLFTNRRDDIAFVLGDIIVILLEHQSTINENMPLRLLIYLARVLEKLIDNEAIYKRKLLKIPKPDFIVLYNGTDPFPDEMTLRLSDAYKEFPEAAEGLGGSLDLQVRVVNINAGRNEAIVRKSEALQGYVRFVGKIRENLQAGLELEGAINKAVVESIKEGILVDFLNTHSSEVLNMLTMEYNEEVAKKVLKQEAREEGLEEGLEKGREEGLEKGREEGLEKGREEGLEKGREEGREEGLEKGVDMSAEIMLDLIKKEPVEEIATRYQIAVEKVMKIQSVLMQYPA